MNSNYLFGMFGALIVVALGVFLIGRDGTEESVMNVEPTPEVPEANLPINPNPIEDKNPGEGPLLESEEDVEALEEEPQDLDENTTAEETMEEVSDTALITYTDQGFSPKTVTINEGDTVVWMNNSSRNMWVASAIHPTHNEYPEESEEDCAGSTFDACIGVAVGQSWSFTFNETGSWNYHDHLSSSRTGTIDVE
jgi:plastocyanin